MNTPCRHLTHVATASLGGGPVNGGRSTAIRWIYRPGTLAIVVPLLQVIIGTGKVHTHLPLTTAHNAATTLLPPLGAAPNHRLAHATGARLSGDRP